MYRRILVAHALSSYLAWIVFIGTSFILTSLNNQWLGDFAFGIAAPLTVPIFLVLSFRGSRSVHIEPRPAAFALWGGYLLCMTTTIGLQMKGHRVAIQRANAGLCGRCGYDLRATPDRCPECGKVPEKPA
jgi:hypothetical protein